MLETERRTWRQFIPNLTRPDGMEDNFLPKSVGFAECIVILPEALDEAYVLQFGFKETDQAEMYRAGQYEWPKHADA